MIRLMTMLGTFNLIILPVLVKVFGLIILLPTLAFSQIMAGNVERFSMEDGLSNLAILDLEQDHEGYIWIAVEDGLIRYDGYEFKSYSNIPGDTTSLSENRVEKLFFSQDSTLWLGMPGSLNKYIPQCDCFYRYDENTSSPFPKEAGQINAFTEDQQRNLWIGTQNGGLFKYDKKNQKFKRYLNDTLLSDHLLGDQVRVLLVDSNNNLWIGTGEPFDDALSGGGLLRFNLNTNEVTRFLHRPEDINSLIDNRVSALMEDLEGKIWIGTCENGLHYFDPLTQTLIRMMPDENNLTGIYAPQGEMGLWTSCPHVRVIHQDEAGGFWIGTYNAGLHYFDPGTNKLTRFIPDPLNPKALSSDAVWSFLYDNQGRAWVGCLPGGLHKIDFSLQKFQIYGYQSGEENSLSSANILSVYGTKERSDQLWIGTRGGGLNFLNLETNQFGSYRHNPGNSNSINNDIVWITYEDSKGTFWVGTESGLQILDRETGNFYDYEIYENGGLTKITDPIVRILEDQSGNLWLGTWSEGLIKLDRKNKSFKRYQFADGSQQTFYNSVFSIYQDSLGNIWAGVFQSGLFQYDVKNDRFMHKIKDHGAVSIIEDSQGILLVGTPHSGLLYYSLSDGLIQQFTMDDGLPSNGIFSIEKDGTGNYWLATGRGISYFNRDSEEFINYGVADGLAVSNFNFSNGYQASDGNIFFAGEGGVARFHPNKIKGNPYPPKVLIKSPFINNQIFDSESNKFSITDLAKLSFAQNDITFNYVGIHFTIPEKNQYRYKLEPYDKDWINAGTQRSVRYTNLDPGTYNFLVTASNSDGAWNDESASVLVVISPPWWKTWWANVLFFLMLGGIIYWIYRFQLSRKLAVAESRRLKDIDAMKSSLYTNITHEFRTPLTVINGMADSLLESAKKYSWQNADFSLQLIKRNGNGLLALVNKMLDLAKLESGHMELNLLQADAIPYIMFICESYQSLADEKDIEMGINSKIPELVMDFDADKLGSVISNLLVNAIKFTEENGRISVMIEKADAPSKEVLMIKIKDTGIGISEEEKVRIFDRFYQSDSSITRYGEGTGIGLALSKELVELMGGSISVSSVSGEGSEFVVAIPVSRKASLSTGIYDKSLKEKIIQPEIETSLATHSKREHLPHLLIVDDNKDVSYYLKTLLSDEYSILQAANGKKGLELAFDTIPDLIICDVMMPQMDGFEMCEILKNDDRTNHIPVIMITAKAEMEDRLTGLSKGADAYLSKPFKKEELTIRIKKLLEVRKQLQEKYSAGLITSKVKKNPYESPSDAFLIKAESIIMDNLEDEDFSTEQLVEALHLSRTQVHRKIKALTGLSTSIYIRMVRLYKAKELLASNDLTVAEVAYKVGFKSPVYFSEVFKQAFHESPSQSRK